MQSKRQTEDQGKSPSHGRRIDADRLKAVVEKNFGFTPGAAVMMQLIDIAPTAEESSNPPSIRVETPLGTLVAKLSGFTAEGYPGIVIELVREKSSLTLALIEFINTEADLEEGQGYIITRVWGEGENDEYTDRIVHTGIDRQPDGIPDNAAGEAAQC